MHVRSRLPVEAPVLSGRALAFDRPPRGCQSFRAVIAIPARDEAARLPACLAALAAQRDAAGRPFPFADTAVLVFANECRDGTAALARALAPGLPFRLLVEERRLPGHLAHAGGARRGALDCALGFLGDDPNGVLLSTDADGRVDPSWLAGHLAALATGVDAVAGRYHPDTAEAARLPAALRAREAAERGYASLLDEMAAFLDPQPHDPWPRHGVHSGASFAITAAAYRAIGGLPPLAVGEDRALFAALARADMRIRHAPEPLVTVSCRLSGRARGGMADTLAQRLRDPAATPVDGRLESALDAWTRFRARRALRRLQVDRPRVGDPPRLALALGITPARLRAIAALPSFGAAWEALQASSPRLGVPRAITVDRLAGEAGRARALLAALHLVDHGRISRARGGADRAGSAARAPRAPPPQSRQPPR
jgi:hypothetical protein